MDNVNVSGGKPISRMTTCKKYTFYWIVVFDRFTGGFYNITLLKHKRNKIEAISKEFQLKNPKFIVAKAGIGLDSRPPEIQNLPHLFYYN